MRSSCRCITHAGRTLRPHIAIVALSAVLWTSFQHSKVESKKKADAAKVRFFPGNNIGYYGPYARPYYYGPRYYGPRYYGRPYFYSRPWRGELTFNATGLHARPAAALEDVLDADRRAREHARQVLARGRTARSLS